MRLSLTYPATAANAPRFAADIVTAAREISQLDLDYSVDGLADVDDVIEGIRNEGVPIENVAETLFGFGAYTGEVLVRHGSARWVDFDESTRRMFGHDFGLETPAGKYWNPLGKAFSRYRNGTEDSLHHFCLVVIGER